MKVKQNKFYKLIHSDTFKCICFFGFIVLFTISLCCVSSYDSYVEEHKYYEIALDDKVYTSTDYDFTGYSLTLYSEKVTNDFLFAPGNDGGNFVCFYIDDYSKISVQEKEYDYVTFFDWIKGER